MNIPYPAQAPPALPLIIGIFAVVIAVVGAGILYSRRRININPGQAAVISGRRYTTEKGETIGYTILTGGGKFIWPVIERVDWLPLGLMTSDMISDGIYTKEFIPIRIEAVAQYRISAEREELGVAARSFLGIVTGRNVEQAEEVIKAKIEKTLEAHIRSICSTITVEEINSDREKFSQAVQKIASEDLRLMGVHLVSFVVKQITTPKVDVAQPDAQNYIINLARPKLAVVERNAAIAEAEYNRDRIIQTAQYSQEAAGKKFEADTKIKEAERDYNINVAKFTTASTQEQKTAELAAPLKELEIKNEMKSREYEILLTEQKRLAEVKEQAVTVASKAAEAVKTQRVIEAEGQAQAIKTVADAEAYQIQVKLVAEAEGIKAKLLAEAEGMAKKAEAWKQYNEAAIAQLVIEKLPEIAASLAEPLRGTEKIVVIAPNAQSGVPSITGAIVNMAAQVPVVYEAVTGRKFTDLLTALPGVNPSAAGSGSSGNTGSEKKTTRGG